MFFTNNFGPTFDCIDNTFNQSSAVVAFDGNSGITVNALSGGSLGNWGNGYIASNKFNISTSYGSNGAIEVNNYGNLSLFRNEIDIFSKPDLVDHKGIALNLVSFANLYDNHVENKSLVPYTGINQLFNVSLSSICCNSTSGLKQGFNFSFANTGKSVFGGNVMHNNEIGLHLQISCKIGDQIDKGNLWTGSPRVTKLTNARNFDNRFHANRNQNYKTQTFPFAIDFWPTQLPTDWFTNRTNIAPEGCAPTSCDSELNFLAPGSTTFATSLLEEKLEHTHLGTGEYADASIWHKERWLYGYLTAHPEMISTSEMLSSFYHEAQDDVRSYELFYKTMADRLTLPTSAQQTLNVHQEQASQLTISHDELWEAFKAGPNSVLYEQLAAVKTQQGDLLATSYGIISQYETGLTSFWQGMQEEANALPDDKPYTLVAKMYAKIYVDRMIHGDEYIIAHHLPTLLYIADLCEPLYPETVILARNMLSHLGVNHLYVEDNNCMETESRRSIPTIAKAGVTLMPNPTTGRVDVLSDSLVKTVELWTANGMMLQTWYDTHQLDISGYAHGVYFLTVMDVNGDKVTKKLIKLE